ncbi:MAG: hypothetical protein AAF637_15270, partial [Pseudomonadota bacterium]
PSGSRFRAGTVIRVHNGTDPGGDPDSREDVYLYADNGESRLGRRNMILRLAAPGGTVLHSRSFHRGLIWNAEDVRIIPSGDGARAFIIPLDAGGSPRPPDIRAHRLELTWSRDIGSEAPILKRFGFTDPEQASLYFSTSSRLPPPA